MKMTRKSMNNKWSTGFFLIATIAVVAIASIRAYSAQNYNAALVNYRKAATINAQDSAKEIKYALNNIYQGLQAISVLPSVKMIDRHAAKLDPDAYTSIVQIYSNMASNIAVSEIYIVAADADPTVNAAMNKKSWEPILMFDGNVSSQTTGIGKDIEEKEEQEYEVLHEQIRYFQQNYDDISAIKDRKLPFISGPETITCDNSEYHLTMKDEDRKGIIFSVPFYDENGKLKGSISAIIRSNIIKNMLPASHHALINNAYDYQLLSKVEGQQTRSREWVMSGKPDPTLIFSTVMPIATADPIGNWVLWTGLPDRDFLESTEVTTIENAKKLSYGFVLVLTILSSVVWEMQRRNSNALSLKIQVSNAESEQFQRRAELLETVVRSANDGIIITHCDLSNPGPEIIYVNDAFCELSGYSAEEMIGNSPRMLQNEFTKRETLDEMKQALLAGDSFKGELLNTHKDGRQYWIDISIVPVKDAQGRVTHFAAIERDITKKKAKDLKEKDIWVQLKRANLKAEAATRDLEESLAKAEAANIAKGEFLANMSHELRTPMNGVLGMASLLADTSLTDEQQEYVTTINSSGESLLMLLNDILDVSKIEAGALELERTAYNFSETLEKTISLLRPQAEKKSIELRYACDASVPAYIWGDSGRMRQIIMNLLGNAIKFTDYGYVCLKVGMEEHDTGDRIYVSVEDTGAGIPASKLDEIFNKFTQADTSVTRKYGGTGLGLAITKQLVGLMGGELGVESAEGKGSTFWFNIPCKIAEASDEVTTIEHLRNMSQQPTAQMPIADARVLLVDDYYVNRIFAEKLLRKFGFQQIDMAEDGVEAVLKCNENSYDMIFMDCQMPNMDGYIATQEIRMLDSAKCTHTPVVAMTANAMIGDREKCLNAGMDDYLSKPLRAEHLKKVLQIWFVLDEDKSSIAAPTLAVASATEESAIDLEQLRMFTDGDPAEEKALVELFLDQAHEMIALLEGNTGADQCEVWKSAAHRFKGSSGNLGAMKLHRLCKQAESNAADKAAKKQEILIGIHAEISQVESFYHRLA